MKVRIGCVLLGFLSLVLSITAQTSSSTGSAAQLPRLVKFSGTLKDVNGNVLAGAVGVTFALYSEQSGGAPLWLETQSVQPDKNGHYTVLLGSTKPQGLPLELFVSEQAQWLGVHPEGQGESPRVLLVAVPYALKAGDAETVGGLAPSAFVLASPPRGSSPGPLASPLALPPATGTTPVTTAGGVVNQLAKFDANADVTSSQVFDNGTNVGIGNTAPAAKLDVSGGGIIRGALQLPATAAATSTAGTNSNALTLTASSFKSGTGGGAVNQNFRWQAEPSGNNTAAPSGTLNLLFGSGSATPAETGLSISNGGALTMRGMTLPSVATASSTSTAGFPSRPMDLLASAWNTSGTPAAVSEHFRWQAEPAGSNTATTAGTLNLLYGAGSAAPAETGLKIGSNGQMTFAAGQTFPGTGPGTITGVTAGTDLTGGGTSGTVTLNVDTTKVPLLASANAFTGNQTVTGSVTASGTVSAGVVNATTAFDLGGKSFASGSTTSGSVFVGFSGNTANTGSGNTAIGSAALFLNTSGANNTASGFQSLELNTTGTSNTAAGYSALVNNTTGNGNTAAGYGSLLSNTTGANNTAFGDYAGNTTNGKPTTGSNNTFVGYFANPGTQTSLSNAAAIGANAQVTASNSMVLGSINGVNGATANTNVGIGTTAPATLLHLNRAVPAGGADLLAITSGGGIDVASLLLQNTGPAGLFLRAGAGTGEAYLATAGPLSFITAGTSSPSGPGPAAMAIDTLGNVTVSSGLMRISIGGLSLGGTAPISVDAPNVSGGRFTVLANGNVGINNSAPLDTLDVGGNTSIGGNATVSGTIKGGSVQINGDTTMSSAPRMSFSAFIPGDLGTYPRTGINGYFIPDRNITLTRVTVSADTVGQGNCKVPAQISVCPDANCVAGANVSFPQGVAYVDSGPISVPIAGGTNIIVYVGAPTQLCDSGTNAPQNAFVNVQYVMQ